MRKVLTLLALLLPAAARAESAPCPPDAHAQLYALTAQAETLSDEVLNSTATGILQGCGPDRVLLSQLLALFSAASVAAEPPTRFAREGNGFRTVGFIYSTGTPHFDPVSFPGPDGAEVSWTEDDERNAYWDLMFAMSGDFLTAGVHSDIYTPGKAETFGCLLYPGEEASALAGHAQGNEDGGELMARVTFLGRSCDNEAHDASGYTALYFAGHADAREADPDYSGLTIGDIRSGLSGFLTQHLDGAAESALFSADDVARLRAY